MKLKIAITLIITLFLSGCSKEDGQIGITSDIKDAIIYIDGDKKGMTGDGYTTIIIEEGEHTVRIFKEKNEEWFYEGSKEIFVGEKSSVKVKIDTETKPTEFRLARLAKKKKAEEERLAKEKKAEEKRLAKEKKAEEKRLAKEKKESILRGKKFGLSSYPKGTFYDLDTKLMWQDDSDSENVLIDWSGAKSYCQSLTVGEYSDWRLPDFKELLSIVDHTKYDPAIKSGFKHVVSDKYWSSDVYLEDPSLKVAVDFYNGEEVYSMGGLNVRCVRGRQ